MANVDEANDDTMVMTSMRITKRHRAGLRLLATRTRPQSVIFREAIDKIIDRYSNMSAEEIEEIAAKRVQHIKDQLAAIQPTGHQT